MYTLADFSVSRIFAGDLNVVITSINLISS